MAYVNDKTRIVPYVKDKTHIVPYVNVITDPGNKNGGAMKTKKNEWLLATQFFILVWVVSLMAQNDLKTICNALGVPAPSQVPKVLQASECNQLIRENSHSGLCE